MEILSIIGGILEIIQIYLIGKRNKFGFLVGIVSSIFWVSYTIVTMQAYGIFITAPIMLFLNIKGYYLWTKFLEKEKIK
jgi:nicotinamide riboside transporter PnuC